MTEQEIFYQTVKAYGLDKEPFELRFLNGFKGGIRYGYFTDVDKAYEVVKNYWRRFPCYFTLQEINPAITARCLNCMEQTKSVTGDADVLNYRYLHIDIDPVRPARIQATEEEVQLAMNRAIEVNKFLREIMGFPAPLIVFSGNGVTLDYRVKRIVANDENKKVMKDVLQVLSLLFSDDKACIDTTVHNASRIIKFAGTISAKGSNTPERPHRYSKILKLPQDTSEVTKNQLVHIASLMEELSNGKK